MSKCDQAARAGERVSLRSLADGGKELTNAQTTLDITVDARVKASGVKNHAVRAKRSASALGSSTCEDPNVHSSESLRLCERGFSASAGSIVVDDHVTAMIEGEKADERRARNRLTREEELTECCTSTGRALECTNPSNGRIRSIHGCQWRREAMYAKDRRREEKRQLGAPPNPASKTTHPLADKLLVSPLSRVSTAARVAADVGSAGIGVAGRALGGHSGPSLVDLARVAIYVGGGKGGGLGGEGDAVGGDAAGGERTARGGERGRVDAGREQAGT
jgi:hypothetical protein